MSWFDDNGIVDQGPANAQIAPPVSASDANQIQGWAQQNLGRNFSDADIAALQGQPLGLVQNGIANSPEAQAYAARNAQPAATAPAQTLPTGYQTPQYQAPSYVAPAAYSGPAPLSALPTYNLPTADEARATPGYQFTRDEGIHGVQTSDIARGAGLGGAALKDIGQYTTGLADSYYGNRVSQGLAAATLNDNNILNVQNSNLAGAGQAFNAGLAGANSQNSFNMNNATNQFGSSLAGMNQQLAAQQQYWGQGFNENQNAFNQYNTTQTNAFDQWYKLAQLGNPGNPYT